MSALPANTGPSTAPITTRLVRTTHARDGTPIFAADDAAKPFSPLGPAGPSFTTLDTRASVPARNSDAVGDFSNKIPHCPPAGVVFCIVDFPARGIEGPLHRTLSLDYAVVLSGEVVIVLEGGAERTVKTGEIIVNQGAMHKWVNRGAERCRLLCFMVGAEKIELGNGRVLEEVVPQPRK